MIRQHICDGRLYPVNTTIFRLNDRVKTEQLASSKQIGINKVNIVASASDQSVCAFATIQRVGTIATHQRVGQRISYDVVVQIVTDTSDGSGRQSQIFHVTCERIGR